jgi:hypothetical protein
LVSRQPQDLRCSNKVPAFRQHRGPWLNRT